MNSTVFEEFDEVKIPRRRHSRSKSTPALEPIINLWILRMLVPLKASKEFVHRTGFRDSSVAQLLGFGSIADDDYEDWDYRIAKKQLRQFYETAERNSENVKVNPNLKSNIDRIAKLVNLNDTDCRILEFAVLISIDRNLEEMSEYLGTLSSVKTCSVLSTILSVPESAIRKSLSVNGILIQSGLISFSRHRPNLLVGKFELISNSFADQIVSFEVDPIFLLRDVVRPAQGAQLTLADYRHIQPTLSILHPYLEQSIARKRSGVNILIYGRPGTGKSQLARSLAQELSCDLFEVSSEDSEGDPIDGERRLRAYRAAQSFFTKSLPLILFDEIEDVFSSSGIFGPPSIAQQRKAWINKTLETNHVPTIWLSNSLQGIDRAFIRRFDLVLELTVPPKKQRIQILQEACLTLLDEKTIEQFSESKHLVPALVTRAASVVELVKNQLGGISTHEAMRLLINNTLEAQGHDTILESNPDRLPEIYDPKFINADQNLVQVATGLKEVKSGRLCLFGPPGTGKTAYVKWLALQLEKPLLIKRASDLMGMFVGQNEKNIALAFKEATQEGAILLIDEVDSFLRDRRGANHGWEARMVNEMLTQMESYPGVFIATTNMMGGIDQAALRRFDLKVCFDFLNAEQVKVLFCRYCTQLGFPKPDQDELFRIETFSMLTPGDFAAVLRQNRFSPIKSSVDLIDALGAECGVKEGSRASIGFI